MTTPDGTENAAQTDSEALEPDTWGGDNTDEADVDLEEDSATAPDEASDGDGDGPEFTPELYRQWAAESGQADAGPEEPAGLLDGLAPKLAAYVEKLRRENAEKRLLTVELGQRLAAASDENARLQDQLDASFRRDVERLALEHRMISPAELWLVADLHEMVTDDGSAADPSKVAEVIEQRVPDYWRTPVQYPKHGPGGRSGATGVGQVRPASWAQALARPQG
jgi:hypothetical protein